MYNSDENIYLYISFSLLHVHMYVRMLAHTHRLTHIPQGQETKMNAEPKTRTI